MQQEYKIERSNYQSFPYHLVDPSPWPILVSFSLLSLMLGAAMYLHGFTYGGYLLTLGFTLTSFGSILWFRDIISEATFLGMHTMEVQKGLSIGVVLFIISEVFAFFSVFWGFFHSSLTPSVEIGGTWPPVGITPLDPFAIPLLNTILLLSSGAFVTWGHHALIAGNRKGAIVGTFFTIVLAIIFTALQYYEYSEAAFAMSDSVYGTVFYASTGLHGLHVIVGTIFIAVGFFRLVNYHLTSTHHQGFEAGILYWHFVDVVWLFLFISVYYWGGN
jgi:cytochrome c oxidase subunit 3